MEQALQEILELFNIKEFRPNQEESIKYIRNNHNVLVVLSTGSGKSLIYQSAAYLKSGVTLVISPLIALMKDQVDKLVRLKIPATFINSSLSKEKQNERLKNMVEGDYALVYVAPERLRQVSFIEAIKETDVGLLAIDEAHCISHWGHDFRPDYLHIADFHQSINNPPPIVALTATATRKVKDEIKQLLNIPDAKEVTGKLDRPNIKLEVVTSQTTCEPHKRKLDRIANIIINNSNIAKDSVICYVGTRVKAERIAWGLREKHALHARCYHAGLDSSDRASIQDAFISGKLPIVVATNAFGMGIDRSNVRVVIHHAIPGSLEAYYQEVGRAGRDGKPSKAVLLYKQEDRKLQDYFIKHSEISYDDLARLHKKLQGQIGLLNHDWIYPDKISKMLRFDKDGVKVRVGLQRLEESGMVEQSFYEGIKRQIYVKNWSEEEARKIVKQLKGYQKRREKQLEEMIAYASSRRTCRRKMLLEHFGKKLVGREAKRTEEKCCDVCDWIDRKGCLKY